MSYNNRDMITRTPELKHITDKNEFLRSFEVRPSNSFSIFLGAGASASAGIPTTRALIWEFKRKLYCDYFKVKEEKFRDLESEINRKILQKFCDDQNDFPVLGSPEEYAFYFERCYPKSIDRQFFIKNLFKDLKPTIGYKCLGALFNAQKVDFIWTTNFDEMVEKGIQSLDSPRQFQVISPDNSHHVDEIYSAKFPKVIKMHGDYKYDSLQNTKEEVQTLDKELRKFFVEENKKKGLIVMGYNGVDNSIMESLNEIADAENPFPMGLIWTIRKGSTPSEQALRLMDKLSKKNDLSSFVEIESFDEFMYELYGKSKISNAGIEKIAENIFEKRKAFSPIFATPGSDIIKLNAIKIENYPKTVYSFQTNINGQWDELKSICEEENLIATFHKGKTFAFGDPSKIKDAFSDSIMSEIRHVDVEEKWIRFENTFFIDLLYQLIGKSLVDQYGLKKNSKRRYYSESHPVPGNFNPKLKIYEALEVQLTHTNNQLYLLLYPTVAVIPTEYTDELKEQRNQTISSIISNRYNKIFNEKLNFWIKLLEKVSNPISFSFSGFEVALNEKLSLAGYKSRSHLDFFQGLFNNKENKLIFSADDPNCIHTHPLKGLKAYGPYDNSFSNKKTTINSSINIALIAPENSVKKISKHLSDLNKSISPKSEFEYLIEYPGFNEVFGKVLVVPSDTSDKLCAQVKDEEIKEMDLINFYEHLKKKIDYFSSLKGDFDLLVIYVPKEWGKYRELKNEDTYFDLHDSVKIYCAKKNIKVQFIEDKSIDYLDPCKVRWWLSLAIYVKANGIPWKNKIENNNTAYVGISYAIKKANKNRPQEVVIGSSQLFDASGQGLRFVLMPIENPVFYGKNPFMNKEDARRLVLRLKDAYFSMDPNAKLEKLVIHKTTPFTPQEIEGISLASEGIPNVELLQIQQANLWRGIRSFNNTSANMFPVLRGTTLQLDDFSFLLWTHGSVIDAQIVPENKNYYQGKRGIPAPLLVRRFRGQDSIQETVQSILNLTRMNWNSAQLYKNLPVTLDFSEDLSEVAKQDEALQNYQYDFRFFM